MDNTILANYIGIYLVVIIFLLSIIDYSFATYLFVVFLPLLYGLQDIEGREAFSVYRILIALLFLVAFIKIRGHWDKFPHKKFIYSYLIFILGVLVSAFLSPSPWTSFTRSLTYLAPLMTFIIIYVAATDNKNGLKYIFKGLILGYAIITVYGIIEFELQENILASLDIIHQDTNWMEEIRLGSGRIGSFIGHPVYLAMYLVITSVAVFFYKSYFVRNPMSTLGFYIILFGSGLCLIYTGTRTAISLGIIFLLSYFILFERNKRKFRLLGYSAIVIIIIMIAVPKLIEYNIESFKIDSTFTTADDQPASQNLVGRIDVTIAMWDIFNDHIFAGLGPGYAYSVDQRYGLYEIAGMENQYAALLADSGIIGFIPYLVFLIISIYILKKSIVSHIKIISEWGKIVLCVLISIIITSISYCCITTVIFHILMIYLGMLFAMEKINPENFLMPEKVTSEELG